MPAAEGATGPRNRSGKKGCVRKRDTLESRRVSAAPTGSRALAAPESLRSQNRGGSVCTALGRALIYGGNVLKSPLDGLHRRLGARMVEFAGYEMPLQYQGIIAEHNACRTKAALFDVSHMGQAEISDPAALEAVVTGDIRGLAPGRQRYSLLMNETGGIVDDLMVANLGDRFQLVLNASRKHDDIAHLRAHGVTVTPHFARALLALQGPDAASLLAEAASLKFMDAAAVTIEDVSCVVTRSGYTGEDGFELGCAAEQAEALAEILLRRGAVPAGLGARDSLRLEAGLCLYGNDIGADTNPIEANLAWAISKRRRTDWDFLGAAPVRAMFEQGPARKLVGIKLSGRAPARAGADIHGADDRPIGRVTSGGFAPSLNAPVALGYVQSDFAAPGTELALIVRGQKLPGTVAPLPFIPHRYVR